MRWWGDFVRPSSRGELARDLASRLFAIAEKKGRSQDAQAYNALVLGWPEVARLARKELPVGVRLFADTGEGGERE
ncbi:MAG: hypothetical protein QN193_01100 [Armatimonadota bacterium]|nr:hypothetical protein [Armatimonadota bacterium]MDR7444691.1 hypothetical protein [Armatimonadota bacterium]MDR7569187.1 hypothetical protein [Armatimonadota bacterium]MDR7613305.1 hypothetical protein [Armatimonadota bacterium]